MTLLARLFLFTSALVTVSCTTTKKVPYLQDAASFPREKIFESYQVNIENDDLLSIVVGSKDTVLARPFNRSTTVQQGYLVNAEGYIDFPVFGKMNVAGWSPAALADTLRSKIVHGGYIKDATVAVKLMNFKISVMGEVNRPGVFPIAAERVTVLEALSLAGDMTIYGKRDRVLIIREEGGQRDMHYLDVNSAALFNSPYFYLRQNDVVYVEPNKSRAGQSQFNPRLPEILTAASVLTSLVSLIVLISK